MHRNLIPNLDKGNHILTKWGTKFSWVVLGRERGWQNRLQISFCLSQFCIVFLYSNSWGSLIHFTALWTMNNVLFGFAWTKQGAERCFQYLSESRMLVGVMSTTNDGLFYVFSTWVINVVKQWNPHTQECWAWKTTSLVVCQCPLPIHSPGWPEEKDSFLPLCPQGPSHPWRGSLFPHWSLHFSTAEGNKFAVSVSKQDPGGINRATCN